MVRIVRNWGVLLLIALLGCSATVGVRAETSDGNIGVNFTVPTQSSNSNNDNSHSSSGGGTTTPPPPPPEQQPVDTPPAIRNVVTTVSETGATITWSVTDDKGVKMSSLVYGLTMNYGQTAMVTGGYRATLSSLTSSTVYFFKINATDTKNQSTEFTGSFKTTAGDDDTTPPVISNIVVRPGATAGVISWQTDESADSQIIYGPTAAYGEKAFSRSAVLTHSMTLPKLKGNTTYHFRIISTDAKGNSATTADAMFTTLKEKVPPTNVANFRVLAGANGLVLVWENPSPEASPDFVGVQVVKKIGSAARNPGEGTSIYTGSASTLTDSSVVANEEYFYTIFSVDNSNNLSSGIVGSGRVLPPPGQEECTNQLDDDKDGAIDCADSECQSLSMCKQQPPAEEPTVPSFARLKFSDVQFFAGNRKISLQPSGERVRGLSGSAFTVAIPATVLVSPSAGITLTINANQYLFSYDAAAGTYYADIIFPSNTVTAELRVDYSGGMFDTLSFFLDARAKGLVLSVKAAVPEATITLLKADKTNRFIAEDFRQINPQKTDASGSFGWMVPNDRYYLQISAEGYYDYFAGPITVSDNILAEPVTLVATPPAFLEGLDLDAPLAENAKKLAKNIAAQGKALIGQAGAMARRAQELADDPAIEQVASTVVAPATVSAVAVGVIPLVSWSELLSLLRFVFLQPVMLLGRRRREKWGQVYNALSKVPVDLAIVRLIDIATGRVLQSRVTDRNGRYYFTAPAGNFRVEVTKDKMSFPSDLLKNFQEDGRKTDIYHGEQIIVNDQYPVITANIPLDPAGEHKTPRRLLWETAGRKLQHLASFVGLAVTAVSFYVAPRWPVGLLLVLHVALVAVFRRLAMPKKPKSWGIVYDAASKKPVGRAVARLYSSQFNKLVSTQVTDNKGRYYFLAGDNRFYLTYDHKDYHSYRSGQLDLSGKEADTISLKVGLQPGSAGAKIVPPAAPVEPPPEQ